MGSGLGKNRAEAFSDGIFSVAMTLLVVELKTPNFDNPNWWADLWPKLITYLASFLIVGMYWIAHHNEFRLIKQTNRWLLWINLSFLLCVVFVPFSTALLGSYWEPRGNLWQQHIPVWVYAGNMLLVGLAIQWFWNYAKRNGFIDPDEVSGDGEYQITETIIRNKI